MSARKHLAIARYENASYRKYWDILQDHDDAMKVRDWEEIIAKGLHSHGVIVETEANYRDQMARGEAGYDLALDLTGLALLTDWMHFSEFVLSQIEPFETRGYQIENAFLFRGKLDATRAILTPPETVGRMPAWQEVARRLDEFLRDLPEPGAIDVDPKFWTLAPVAEVVADLRRHNLAARGLDPDEIAELADLFQYPGTLLGELQEHYWHSRNSVASVK